MINKSNQYLCIIDKRCCQLVDSSKSSSTPFARRIPQFVSIRAFECDTYTVRFIWILYGDTPRRVLRQRSNKLPNWTPIAQNSLVQTIVDTQWWISTQCVRPILSSLKSIQNSQIACGIHMLIKGYTGKLANLERGWCQC